MLEQEEIVAELEPRLSIVNEIEAQVEANPKRAARLRQGILKRAFEGRLVPQDPTEEPAEQLMERISLEPTEHRAPRRISGNPGSSATASLGSGPSVDSSPKTPTLSPVNPWERPPVDDIKLTLSKNPNLRSQTIEEEARWMNQEGPLYYTLSRNKPLRAEAGCCVYFIKGGQLAGAAPSGTHWEGKRTASGAPIQRFGEGVGAAPR